MFLRLFLMITLASISACDILTSKDKAPKLPELEKIETSKENCLEYCKPMNRACDDFTQKLVECEKTNTENSCLDSVKSFKSIGDMFLSNSFDCKEACGHEFNDNRLKICEVKKSETSNNLTQRFINVIKTHPSPAIKALNLSEVFTKIKDKEFNERYYRSQKEKLSFEMPKIFTIQEKTKDGFEVWLRRKELDCLSKNTLKKIENLKSSSPTKKVFDLSDSYKDIAKSCGLKNTKDFPPRKGNVSKYKFSKVTYFIKSKPSSLDDCNYTTPRLVITYEGSTGSEFLVSKDFKRSEDDAFNQLLAKLNENPKLYRGFGFNFFGAFTYKNKNFVFSGVPSMAEAYQLLEVTSYGLKPVPMTLSQEPCGS